MPRYEKWDEGEWVQPVEDGFKSSCCDCGAVHKMDFRVYDGRAQFRAFRDNRATGQVRRHRKVVQSHRGLCAFLRDAMAVGMLDESCHETARKTMAAAEEISPY